MRGYRFALAAGLIAFAALGACSPPAQQAASAAKPAGLTIGGAWAPATPGGVKTAAGYLTITNNTAADDRLVSAVSPRAAHVEIHSMEMQGEMMTMRPMEGGLLVPAGKSASLAPGGAHLMFIDITAPFAAGDTIPVTLTFEKAGAVETTLPVRAPGAAP